VDGAQAREALRQATQTPNRVDEGRVTVAREGVGVQLAALDKVLGRLVQVVIVEVEGDAVAGEEDSVLLKAEVLEQLAASNLPGREKGKG